MNEPLYVQAADVYNEAVKRGSHTPTKDVAEYFGIERKTATSRVSSARERGLVVDEPMRERCPMCGAMPSRQDVEALWREPGKRKPRRRMSHLDSGKA